MSRQGIAWLECARLARLPWLLHAFSTRGGGASKGPAAGLNLGFTESDSRKNVEHNQRLFFKRLEADLILLASVRQVHSAAIYLVVRGRSRKIEYLPSGFTPATKSGDRQSAGDALMTDEKGILLSVRVADCLPVLLADVRRRAVAAIHAGWRGMLHSIVEKGVGEMRRVFGSRPQDLVAALGPSIRACCYEVGEEVRDAFCGRFPHGDAFFQPVSQERLNQPPALPHVLSFLPVNPPGHGADDDKKYRLDLVAAARAQLRSAGVSPSNIEVADFCTACRTDLFFSHRKEGSRTGRMLAVIGTKPKSGTSELTASE